MFYILSLFVLLLHIYTQPIFPRYEQKKKSKLAFFFTKINLLQYCILIDFRVKQRCQEKVLLSLSQKRIAQLILLLGGMLIR